jgi:hypothetical protein
MKIATAIRAGMTKADIIEQVYERVGGSKTG